MPDFDLGIDDDELEQQQDHYHEQQQDHHHEQHERDPLHDDIAIIRMKI